MAERVELCKCCQRWLSPNRFSGSGASGQGRYRRCTPCYAGRNYDWHGRSPDGCCYSERVQAQVDAACVAREPLQNPYRVYCVLCGRDEWKRMSEADARKLRFISPCMCGGARWIEPDQGTRLGVQFVLREPAA